MGDAEWLLPAAAVSLEDAQSLRQEEPWTQREKCVDAPAACSLAALGLTVCPRSCVDRVDSLSVSVSQFWHKYLLPNRPVLLTGLTASWHCQREWVTPDGAPDCGRLRALFADVVVLVADCSLPEDAPRLLWTLGQYCDYLDSAASDKRRLYLKDAHLVTESARRGLPVPYTTPAVFADDWLNAYYDAVMASADLDAQVSDYRFTYMGPPGTHTGRHADVLRSCSWSSNLCGTKHWRLYPPGAAEPMELLVQGPGDTVFVPAGWEHDVYNVGAVPVLSVNHNWLCASSLDVTWHFLRDETRLATQCIEDIRACTPPEEFLELVARNTRANAGLDCNQFAWLIYHAVLNCTHGAVLRRGRHAGEDPCELALAMLAATRAAQVLREIAAQPPGLVGPCSDREEAASTPLLWAQELERLMV
jgi:hypothetical protein